MSPRLAIGAMPAQFDRRFGHVEGALTAGQPQLSIDRSVDNLLRVAATVAYHENRAALMVVAMGAGNKCIQALKPMRQTQLDQAVQGPIDRRRRRDATAPNRINQFIRCHRSPDRAQGVIDRGVIRG